MQHRAEIYIEGEITDTSPAKLKSQLTALGANTPVDLHINSAGGSVFAGVTMANMIARHKGKTRAFNDGLTASIAGQIYFSADECYSPSNCFFMLHRPIIENQGGNAEALRKTADTLDRLQAGLETTYQRKARAGITPEEIRALVEGETWLTGTEAASKFQITLLEPRAAVNLAGIDFLKSQGITVPAMLNERTDFRMKRSDELRQRTEQLRDQIGHCRMTGDYVKARGAENELAIVNNMLDAALRQEEAEWRDLQRNATPLDMPHSLVNNAPTAFATPTASKAKLRNRAFNKLLFSKVKGDLPMLTDEEKQAYYNVSGSPGSPGQIEAVPARGGYLVSVEQMNVLQEFRSAFTALKDYTNVIAAASSYGRWPTLPDQAIEFEPLVEMTDIAESEIAFSELEYKINDYALIIPCSNQLLDDADVDLISVIGQTLAKGSIRTENKKIVAQLNKLITGDSTAGFSPAITITNYKQLNTALYRTLDGVFEPEAKIFCNQDSFLWLSNLEDGQNRPLMVPDVTAPAKYLYRGKEIVVIPNTVLPNTVNGSSYYAPIFIGDMKSFLSFFERRGLELSTSDSYLWRKAAFAVRGVLRFDVVLTDPRAMVALQVAVLP